MASKGVGALPRRRGSAPAHGCGRSGRVALPLARAATISTGLRVRREDMRVLLDHGSVDHDVTLRDEHA